MRGKCSAKYACALLAIMSAVGLLGSCADDATAPNRERVPFSFAVSVVDVTGAPVPGLQVAIKNHLSIPPPFDGGSVLSRKSMPMGSTVLPLSVGSGAKIDVEILDVAGQWVETLVESYPVVPGKVSLAWQPAAHLPDGPYRYRVTARDTVDHAVLFRAERIAVMYRNPFDGHVLGVTDEQGIFRTIDAGIFPALFDLPPLVQTSIIGEEEGTFFFEDTFTLVVSDVQAQTGVIRGETIRVGHNGFSILWDPTAPVPAAAAGPVNESSEGRPKRAMVTRSADPEPQFDWELQQNYPNPFN